MPVLCRVPGCTSKSSAHRLCSRHVSRAYSRFGRDGARIAALSDDEAASLDTLAPVVRPATVEPFVPAIGSPCPPDLLATTDPKCPKCGAEVQFGIGTADEGTGHCSRSTRANCGGDRRPDGLGSGACDWTGTVHRDEAGHILAGPRPMPADVAASPRRFIPATGGVPSIADYPWHVRDTTGATVHSTWFRTEEEAQAEADRREIATLTDERDQASATAVRAGAELDAARQEFAATIGRLTGEKQVAEAALHAAHDMLGRFLPAHVPDGSVAEGIEELGGRLREVEKQAEAAQALATGWQGNLAKTVVSIHGALDDAGAPSGGTPDERIAALAARAEKAEAALDAIRDILDRDEAPASDAIVKRLEDHLWNVGVGLWQALDEPEGSWPLLRLAKEAAKRIEAPAPAPSTPSLLDLDALERDARARLDAILQIKALAPVALGRAA
jgi:hypothetical protein